MNKLSLVISAIALSLSSVSFAATERMPCKSTEATTTVSGSFIWVACPTEGRLMPEGMEVHYRGDWRDFVVKNKVLVPLDGPVGSTSSTTDPRVKTLENKIAKLKAELQAIIQSM